MKNILSISGITPEADVTTENAMPKPVITQEPIKHSDNIFDIRNDIAKDLKMLDECTGMLTHENSIYVDKVQNFFVDSVSKLGPAIQNIKDRLFQKKDTYTIKISELEKYGRANKEIKSLSFSKYENMQIPVMLGTDSDYLTISQKLKEFPKSINVINRIVSDYTLKIEKLMNTDSEERKVLKDYHTATGDVYEESYKFEKLIDSIVNGKSSKDTMELQYLIPNFSNLDTIKNNFKDVCNNIHLSDIDLLENNIQNLVDSVGTWSRIVKGQEDTRHSKNAVTSIRDGIKGIANIITSLGILLSTTFQFVTFYNRMIVLLENKVS